MKGLVGAAVVASVAAGVPSAPAAPDRKAEDAARAPGISGGTGLSFEDLRAGPTGKVAARIGNTEVPVRVADNSTCNPMNTGCR
jgi:hypothetical protein